MERVICVLERIGGYSGKRVQIKRIAKIKYADTSTSDDKYKCFFVKLVKKADVLKVKKEIIDLDKFMRLLQLQGEFDDGVHSGKRLICDLYYEEGEVVKFELKEIFDILYEICDDQTLKQLNLRDYEEGDEWESWRGYPLIDLNKILIENEIK